MGKRIVKIKARRVGQVYDYDASDLELRRGDRVLIETEKGLGIGTVMVDPQEIAEQDFPKDRSFKKVLRKANRDDLDREVRNSTRETEAFRFCQQKIEELRLMMKLIQVENFYDGSKMIFYFSAPERVDFRELVHQLAQRFHTRIEMQQIGVRDEAKLLGGIGLCGRTVCCQAFLSEFEPVSVRLAKDQDLPLNPQKLSGPCGRLLCCLAFEHGVYQDASREMPQLGERVEIARGKGEVTGRNIFTRTVMVLLEEGEEVEVASEEARPLREERRGGPPKGPGRKGGGGKEDGGKEAEGEERKK